MGQRGAVEPGPKGNSPAGKGLGPLLAIHSRYPEGEDPDLARPGVDRKGETFEPLNCPLQQSGFIFLQGIPAASAGQYPFYLRASGRATYGNQLNEGFGS